MPTSLSEDTEAAPTEAPRASGDQRFAQHYPALRQMARSRLRRHETFTLLDTTALVHESYLRLSRSAGVDGKDAPAFLAYAGEVMRSVIVDTARARLTLRRGEGAKPVPLDDEIAELVSDAPAKVIVELYDALLALEQSDARLAKIIEYQYYGGMTDSEIALALGLSDRTIRREAERARRMLRALLS